MFARARSRTLGVGCTSNELEGKYDPPFGPVGVVFDAIPGRQIAATSADAFLQDIKQFIESDYQMAASTSLASSPKEQSAPGVVPADKR
jgi:hypothetical protein